MFVRGRSRKAGLYGAILLLIAFLGWVDYVTGRELNFFLFYFIPISIAACGLGAAQAVAVSVVCAATWALSDSMAGASYTAPFYAVWNTGIRLVAFVVVALAISKISALLHAERKINEELRAARAQLKILEGLLPICAYCKKIRSADGGWEQLERFITQHSEARFSHGVCPACKQDLLKQAAPTAGAPPL